MLPWESKATDGERSFGLDALSLQTGLFAVKFFPPLKDNDIIEEKERKGKEVFFGLTSKYLPLKMFIEYQEKLKQKVTRDKVGQSSLLDDLAGWSNK